MLSSLAKTFGLAQILRPINSSLLIKNNIHLSQRLNADSDDSKIILTEDQPEIPPNYGFPGNEDVRSIYEMKKINRSFKYGNPPKLRRNYIKGPLVIRLIPISNCSNRRFFRIAVTHQNYDLSDGFIEDLGSIDPMPNKDNNIMVALNIERIKYYLSRSTPLNAKVSEILGLAGLLPLHPNSYLTAYRNRKKQEAEKTQEQVEK
ncbi:putative 28S ribosomal mitochondrial [Brachionus plicatilis]|uniref:Small ribosomal subunit protein bS16m n=1 Tax=Brachionus plicatilis TaxID=10195 RepID=A0A3M7R7R0_BRAPC|nr:putative 28S ribosomal mitochondrial [Brachionus plicatilis]